MADLEKYQRFVGASSIHTDSMERILEPIKEALDLVHQSGGYYNQYSDAMDAVHIVEEILPLCYVALGLCGEAGEFADKVKKLIRDEDGVMTPRLKTGLVKEAGDVEWYATEAARVLGTTKSAVIDANVDKIKKRIADNTQKGDGDDR